MKNCLFVLVFFLVAGCTDEKTFEMQWGYDQCVRPVLFQQCMTSLPKGPSSIAAASNDWAEVVEACEDAARSQSARRIEQIKPECRS